MSIDRAAVEIGAYHKAILSLEEKCFFKSAAGSIEELQVGGCQRVALTPPLAAALFASASTAAWLTMVISPGISCTNIP